jgi:two-component system sensor histidine kinase TctE
MKTAASLHKLLLVNLAVVLIPTLLAGISVAYIFAQRGITHSYDLNMLDVATDIGRQLQMQGGVLQFELSPAMSDVLLHNNEDNISYAVWGDDSALIAGDRTLMSLAKPLGERRYRFDSVMIEHQQQRMIVLREAKNGRFISIAVVTTTHQLNSIMQRILSSMIALGLAIAAMSTLAAVISVRRGLRPVATVRNAIVERSPAELQPLSAAMAPLELRPIVTGVNELMHKLELSIESHRRFIADASHQLRTPLAVLQGQIEVALRHPDGDQSQTLYKLLGSVNNLTHLSGQLLSLARLDHLSQQQLPKTGCDLEVIIRGIAAQYIVAAETRSIECSFYLQSCSVSGNAMLLQEMLKNLFDNAIRYIPIGGHLEVLLQIEGEFAVLQFRDNGPGVAPAALGRLGTRFFREKTVGFDGCGLGLAIVREIVELHSGQVNVSNRNNLPGLEISILLPVYRMPLHTSRNSGD